MCRKQIQHPCTCSTVSGGEHGIVSIGVFIHTSQESSVLLAEADMMQCQHEMVTDEKSLLSWLEEEDLEEYEIAFKNKSGC